MIPGTIEERRREDDCRGSERKQHGERYSRGTVVVLYSGAPCSRLLKKTVGCHYFNVPIATLTDPPLPEKNARHVPVRAQP